MSIWDGVDANVFLQNEWEGYNKPVRQQYRSFLKQLRPTKMLEVGCGPGVDYMGAVTECPGIDYTGADITLNMVEHCKNRFPNGTFLQADIFNLPFSTQSFDLVYCKDVLNHLDRWDQAFAELLRVSNRYVLVNFFYGLGAVTVKERHQRNQYIDNFYDWNEVMTKLYSLRPARLTIVPIVCPPNGEETMILFQK